MRSAIRYDQGELKPAHESPEGYLYIDAYATRAGVFAYRRADGTTRYELRPPEEVGKPESLATLARKPITDLHPDTFVDAANVKELGVGSVDPEVVWEEDSADGFVRVRGTISRKDAVEKVKAGRREVSCGYTADIDETPGEWTDAAGVTHRYDAIQRNIRYNHLALVDRGRAGNQVRLRLDEAEMIMPNTGRPGASAPDSPRRQKETPMTIKIDGKEYSIDEAPAIQRAIVELETKRADMAIGMEEMKAALEEKKAKLEEALMALAAFEKQAAESMPEQEGEPSEMEEDGMGYDKEKMKEDRLDWAAERFSLIDMARELKLDGFDDVAAVRADNGEIKRAIVLSRFDEADVPSDAHVDAALSLMRKADRKDEATVEKSTKGLAQTLAGNVRADKATDTIAEAQNQYLAWISGNAHN